MDSLLHTVGGYEHDSSVLGVWWLFFFFFSIAFLCANSNLQYPRCVVVQLIKGLEDAEKQLQLRLSGVSQLLVLATRFHGVSNRAVTITPRALEVAPLRYRSACLASATAFHEFLPRSSFSLSFPSVML